METWTTSLRSLLPKGLPWAWIERALFLAGILFLGIYAWAWLDARFYEKEQERLLEQAIAAGPPPPVQGTHAAAETDSFESLRKDVPSETRQEKQEKEKPAPAPAPLAPDEGELIGRIKVPRLGVSAILMEGVGRKTLRRGAGHIPATAMPSEEEGNVGIAAHRDSFFRGLKDIREDDTIELTTLDGTFRYEVEWTKIVKPDDISVLAPTEDPALTLVTCYPFYYVGSAPKRFIVRAHRIDQAIPSPWSGDTTSTEGEARDGISQR